MSLSSTTTTLSTSTTLPLASQTPLIITLRTSIPRTGSFFPFHDVADLDDSSGDLFSFRTLIEDGVEDDSDVALFASGCLLPNGTHDCHQACGQTRLFFSGLETFYNCAALASITYRARDGTGYYISDEAERNVSSLMGEAGKGVKGFERRGVLEAFVECAVGACAGDALGKACERNVSSLNQESSDEQILKGIDDFCPVLEAEIDPDIFGPGVLISYVMQVSFAMSLYLLLKFFNLYVRWSQNKPQRTPSGGLRRVKTIIWKDSSALSRTSIAIATTLVEFQEAQAWFVFAVQIASILAIVVNSSEGTFWGEIIVNAAVAYHISQNGVLPMFLIQVSLHNEGIRNWHTFLGFLVEYLLAIVAATQTISFRSAVTLFKKQNEIPACGYQPSPRTYCAARSGTDGLQINFFPHPLLYKMVFIVLDGITILALIADQLMWTARKHHKTKNLKFGHWRPGRGPMGRWKKEWNLARKWFWRGLEIVYLIVNLLYLVSLIMVINGESFAANRWAYGQIIAMTVWGPVIVKLFDLILSGPPKNGRRLNSGPPRLRIDNILNRRHGSIADEDLDPEPNVNKPRAKSVDYLTASRVATQDKVSTDGGQSDDVIGSLLEARRTLDVRFEEQAAARKGQQGTGLQESGNFRHRKGGGTTGAQEDDEEDVDPLERPKQRRRSEEV